MSLTADQVTAPGTTYKVCFGQGLDSRNRNRMHRRMTDLTECVYLDEQKITRRTAVMVSVDYLPEGTVYTVALPETDPWLDEALSDLREVVTATHATVRTAADPAPATKRDRYEVNLMSDRSRYPVIVRTLLITDDRAEADQYVADHSEQITWIIDRDSEI